ncbi:hypothetical protein [Streptomyces sp. NBC_00425]|uniref:hypothetical protein n=1 Tax=Streptomyces sp. NBC_00425 TaxID=2975740 RepID=UPI002E218CF5
MTGTTAFSMPSIRYKAYGPDHFRPGLPFGRTGYLLTVPGDFPSDTHVHTNLLSMQLAVYRAFGEWEVRDVDGPRKAWGTGATRAAAVATAYAELYRVRIQRAADIAEHRRLCGLEDVPPFAVEVTNTVTLVSTRTGIAVLDKVLNTTPTTYLVTDPRTGTKATIPAADTDSRTTSTGFIHERCGCEPSAAWFENEDSARDYAEELLTTWWPCPGSAG